MGCILGGEDCIFFHSLGEELAVTPRCMGDRRVPNLHA